MNFFSSIYQRIQISEKEVWVTTKKRGWPPFFPNPLLLKPVSYFSWGRASLGLTYRGGITPTLKIFRVIYLLKLVSPKYL